MRYFEELKYFKVVTVKHFKKKTDSVGQLTPALLPIGRAICAQLYAALPLSRLWDRANSCHLGETGLPRVCVQCGTMGHQGDESSPGPVCYYYCKESHEAFFKACVKSTNLKKYYQQGET